MLEPVAGRLLVATPELGDPNFTHTVVFLLAVQPIGAIGVVLNRPGDRTVAEVVPQFDDVASEPRVVFLGGPVDLDSVVGLSETGAVDLSEVDDLGATPVRLFAGSAGWGPGQLDREIADGSWWVLDTLPGDVVTPTPETLWSDVLRRQGGVTSWFALATSDPHFN